MPANLISRSRGVQSDASPWHVILVLTGCMALLMTGSLAVLPLFAHRFADFGAGVQALGLSSLAGALAGTLAAPAVGTVADRLGRRPLVLTLAVLQVLATAGFLFASSAEWYILLRGISGACTMGMIPAVMGIVADVAPQERRAQSIAIVNGGSSVGWVVGPLVGGLLFDQWGYLIPFAFSLGMALLTLLFAVGMIPETLPSGLRTRERESAGRVNPEAFPLGFPLLVLLVISFTSLLVWALVEPELMFYAYDELQWTSVQLGFIVSVYGVAVMLGEFTLGRLSDRLGRKPVLVLGLGLYAAQFFGLVFWKEYLFIAGSFVVAGLGNAIYDPALSALFLDMAPRGYSGRAMAFKTTVSALGSMAGPALVVLLTPFLAARGIFAISLLLVVAILVVAAVAVRAPAEASAQESQDHGVIAETGPVTMTTNAL